MSLMIRSGAIHHTDQWSTAGMSNTSDFILMKEDHTLGNLLAEHLKAHPNVYMAGYKSMSCRQNFWLRSCR